MRYIMILVLCANLALAQPVRQSSMSVGGQTPKVYEIPFASKGNVIELSVVNTSTLSAEGIKVKVTNAPENIYYQV